MATTSSARSKLPKTVKIAAYTYTVEVDDAKLYDLAAGRPAVAVGEASSQSIVLSAGKAPDYTADSLLHEILHQCIFLGNNNLPDDEPYVSACVVPLLQTIRDNPALVQFLLKPSGT